MKSAIPAAIIGIVFGSIAGLAYDHFLGEGKALHDAEDQLAQNKAMIDKAAADSKNAKSETDALTEQVDQLTAKRDDLQKQLDTAKTSAPAATDTAKSNPFGAFGGMIKTVMARQRESKLLALKARLHLTPEQEAEIKAALDEEAKRGDDIASKMAAGQKINPADWKNNQFVSLDQELDKVLTPDQKTEYSKMKVDEKNSAAESVATMEMNQMAPALQLNDSQKDQVYSALAQVQIDTQDPNWIKNSGVNLTDPTAVLQAQAKAKEDALAKILTPDQMTTYRQQAESQLQMQKEMIQKFMPAANGSSPAPAASAAPAPANP